jgi:hypothetical protein
MAHPTEEHIFSVHDHGLWHGHRTWTVRMTGPSGPTQVSVLDEPTETKAIEKALEIYRNRRVFSDEEKAAMQRHQNALKKGLLDK